jgi:ferredoxin
MEEQFLVDNLKESWILHMLSRQFGEMNLQCGGSCFCGLCKGDFCKNSWNSREITSKIIIPRMGSPKVIF